MAVTEHRFRVMASDAHVIAIDAPAGALAEAQQILERIEQRWSRFLPDSDVTRINLAEGRPVVVDPLTITLIATMAEAWQATHGRYDPTVLPILVADGYRSSIDQPSRVTILPATARHVGGLAAVAVDAEQRTVTAPPGVSLDPGGIGKGLAADLVVAQLLAAGASGALVDVGGDLACAGTPPLPSGWAVTVEHPDEPEADLVTFTVSAGGVATSSTRSRRWPATAPPDTTSSTPPPARCPTPTSPPSPSSPAAAGSPRPTPRPPSSPGARGCSDTSLLTICPGWA